MSKRKGSDSELGVTPDDGLPYVKNGNVKVEIKNGNRFLVINEDDDYLIRRDADGEYYTLINEHYIPLSHNFESTRKAEARQPTDKLVYQFVEDPKSKVSFKKTEDVFELPSNLADDINRILATNTPYAEKRSRFERERLKNLFGKYDVMNEIDAETLDGPEEKALAESLKEANVNARDIGTQMWFNPVTGVPTIFQYQSPTTKKFITVALTATLLTALVTQFPVLKELLGVTPFSGGRKKKGRSTRRKFRSNAKKPKKRRKNKTKKQRKQRR